ncbi:hypothetical protein HRbin06_00335 [archaeon HR06]|nr:hypothetical protein HRbin06_00335 [archaeon HR06]
MVKYRGEYFPLIKEILQNGYLQIMILAIFSLAFFTILGLIYPFIVSKRKKANLTKIEPIEKGDLIKRSFYQELIKIRGKREREALITLYNTLRSLVLEALNFKDSSDLTERELSLSLADKFNLPEFYQIYEAYERVRFGNYNLEKEELNYLINLAENLIKKVAK